MKRVLAALRSFLAGLDWKQTALYAVVFVFVFFGVFYLTFPFDTIKATLVTELEARTGAKVEVARLRPLRMSGVQAEGVRLMKPSDNTQVLADIDLMRFRVHLAPLFRARTVVDFDLEAYGGGLSGVIEGRTGKRFAVAVNFLNLDLNRYNFAKLIENYGQMSLYGKLSGNFNLYFDGANRRNSQGAVDLKFEGMKIADATIMTKTLPEINFEPAAVKMDFKRSAFSISQWDMNGDNLSINMTGRVTMNENLNNSRISFTLKAKPSETLLDQFAELAMMKAPDSQGWYTLRINGPFSKPNVNFR
ncbi:MAG: type II secretion system protein GspN [Deltaproteobacteria bacterium]|nr:type II secretion system protein GspN [Deltaproteobacteria bacterium]